MLGPAGQIARDSGKYEQFKSSFNTNSTTCEIAMANIHSDVPPVLTCWKDIAQYLGKGVRTVQRWEQEFGLPVRRPNGIDHKSPVAAHPADLDEWLQKRWSARNSGKTASSHRNGNRITNQSLDEMIRTTQELRTAHSILLNQTAKALEKLIHSCHELEHLRLNGFDKRLE